MSGVVELYTAAAMETTDMGDKISTVASASPFFILDLG